MNVMVSLCNREQNVGNTTFALAAYGRIYPVLQGTHLMDKSVCSRNSIPVPAECELIQADLKLKPVTRRGLREREDTRGVLKTYLTSKTDHVIDI